MELAKERQRAAMIDVGVRDDCGVWSAGERLEIRERLAAFFLGMQAAVE